MCIAAWNREKFTKKPYFVGSRSFKSSMLVPPERLSAVLVMMSSKSVSICNRSHARRANSGKITISKGEYPCLMPSFEGNLLTQRHQITSLETRNCRLSYGEKPMSLSDLGLIQCRVVTPHTDRIPIPAGTAVTRKKTFFSVETTGVAKIVFAGKNRFFARIYFYYNKILLYCVYFLN